MKLEKLLELYKLHKDKCGEYACTDSQFTFRAMFTARIWSDEELINRRQPNRISNAYKKHKAKHGSKASLLPAFRGRVLTQGWTIERAIATASVVNNAQAISIDKLHLALYRRGDYNKTIYYFRKELNTGVLKLRDVATEDEMRMLALHKKNREYL